MEILEAEMGNAWRFDQEFAFETQLSVLESILDSKATIGGIQSLLTELKNSNGWSLAMSFPLIVRFAKEYLKQNGATPAPEDNAAALKFIADLEVEMSK